jgi:hypothetical protein
MSETSREIGESLFETKVCESCGKDFSCGAKSETCWCFEIDLSKATLANLQKDFRNCLCPDCLKPEDKDVYSPDTI